MTQWIPWQAGQPVEEWAKRAAIVCKQYGPDSCIDLANFDDGKWWDDRNDEAPRVVAYARLPAPYKPVVGIAVGQVRRTPLGVEIEVSRSRKMSDERTLCKIRLADCYTIYERVPTDDLATWPVVRVEQDDDK